MGSVLVVSGRRSRGNTGWTVMAEGRTLPGELDFSQTIVIIKSNGLRSVFQMGPRAVFGLHRGYQTQSYALMFSIDDPRVRWCPTMGVTATSTLSWPLTKGGRSPRLDAMVLSQKGGTCLDIGQFDARETSGQP